MTAAAHKAGRHHPHGTAKDVATHRAKRFGINALWLLALSLPAGVLPLVATPAAQAQAAAKTIEGKVLDIGSTPLPGSIVYLQDQKTNIVKTYIATADGSYRFGQLPPDTDYKVWAANKGIESKSKLISSFDTKRIVSLDFHIGK